MLPLYITDSIQVAERFKVKFKQKRKSLYLVKNTLYKTIITTTQMYKTITQLCNTWTFLNPNTKQKKNPPPPSKKKWEALASFIKGDINKYVHKHRMSTWPGYMHKLSPVKRICVFEHSVMTNLNCACPDIQRGQGSGFLSEGSSWLTACMSEQRRFWRDCADAQARLNLRCSHRR